MQKTVITLATIALIAAGCTQEDLQITPAPHTVAVAVAFPGDETPARVSLQPDAGTGSNQGLVLKWEAGDKLLLNFEHNGAYYPADAPIVDTSISADGKRAQFTITVPSQIPPGATFNLYGVYQRTDTYNHNGGYFIAGTNTYQAENVEEQNITLNQLGTLQRGKTSPMLYFSQTGIANTPTPAVGEINLTHAGWIMAIHFKNSSGNEIDLPQTISLWNANGTNWVYNHFSGYSTIFDLASQKFTQTLRQTLRLSINEYSWEPLYGKKLANGAAITFYRWVASMPDVPELSGKAYLGGAEPEHTSTLLPAKTVVNGEVYHVYTEWNGTNFEFVPEY